MKRILWIVWVFLLGTVHAQTPAAKDSMPYSPSIRLGASYTYIWDVGDHYLKERTLAMNVGVMVKPRINIGVNWLNIAYETNSDPNGRGFLMGTFGQYHLGKRLDKATIFLESGVYWGNYCTCGQGDPYRKNGLLYVPVGGGLNARLWKSLWLDAGFLVYNNLNKVEDKYSFTQYVVGLDWVIGK